MSDFVGRISGEKLSLNNLKTLWKDHIQEYFITSPVDGVEFKLDIVGEETLTAENDVTDHYVESNKAYQDQITRKPKIYTINGEVGELVWYQRDTLSQNIGQVAQRLEGVISFLPVRSRGFQQMKNKVMQAAQWVDTASNIVSRLSDIRTAENDLEIGGTKQQQAYLKLLEYRENVSKPLTFKTPWGVLENYVITALKFTQQRETKDKSLISITLKEFRTTSVATVEYDEEKYQGFGKYEHQPKVNNGNTEGTDSSISEPVSKKDSNNPFKLEGGVGGSGTEYIANVTDGNEKYQVLYDTRYKDDIIITSNGQTIIDGSTKYKALSASAEAIKNEMNRRTAVKYASIMRGE